MSFLDGFIEGYDVNSLSTSSSVRALDLCGKEYDLCAIGCEYKVGPLGEHIRGVQNSKPLAIRLSIYWNFHDLPSCFELR